MGERIRAFDWSRTELGPIDRWPGALRSAVAICLGSRFPMMIWWGRGLVNLYNDGYRSILGQRHPAALGQSGRAVWADVWEQIVGQVEAVLTRGESTWNERVHLVTDRNGKPEETWFTFSYSPIPDDDGAVGGLLNTVREETAHVLAERARDREAASRRVADGRARAILETINDAFFAVDRDWRFTYVNPQADRVLNRTPGDLLGRSIWEAFPGLAGSRFEAIYRDAMAGGAGGSITSYYPDHDRHYEVHAYPAEGGISIYFRDVTEQERRDADRRRLEAEREQALRAVRAERANLAAIVERAPAFIVVLRGPEHVVGLATRRYQELVGRTDLVGRAIREALPEVEGQGFFELLDQVYRTGEPYVGTEVPVVIGPAGTADRDRVISFVYQALHGEAGDITGIFVHGVDVTDAVRAREAVAAAEARRRIALDSAGLGSFNMDGVTGALTTDDRLRSIFGLPGSAAATFEQMMDAIHPDDQARVRKAIGVATRSDGTAGTASYGAEHRVVHPDGTVHWVHGRGRANFGPDGRLASFDGTVADVTDRKRAEFAARDMADRYERQSRLFERIASATPDFIYVFGLDGRFVYANRRLLEVWGRTFDQAVGRSLVELGYPQWHAEMHLREIAQVIETRQSVRGEVPFTGGSGISGIYEYIFTPVLGPDGRVEAIAGTTRDVTERRATDERMARDATLLAYVQDAVVVTDLNGVVTFWNAGATRLFGVTAEQMVGRPYAERLPEGPLRDEVSARIVAVAAGGPDYQGERETYRRDGSRVWIDTSTRRIADPGGRALGIMGVSHDISERKRAEAEREQLLASERAARADAEHASRMKDEFLATLSHELRTPLNAILGWAQIMRDGGGEPDPDDVRQGMEVIERNARAQSQIIEDLLDMSRIISGKVRLDVQRLDLSALVATAVETARPTADAKGVRLQSVIDPLHGVVVTGDASRLQQVLWNLLSNAVKFTPKGGRVQVLLERVNSHLELSVIDTGEGIPADFLPYVFDRFRQADASITRRHGGLGLGLSIVKQLVELHGGSVRVKSAGPGQGSTFVVALPVTILHPGDDDAPHRERRHPRVAPHATGDGDACVEIDGVRVLVVDDEPDARTLVKRLLEDCHATVTTAASADEAARLVETGAFDVLVSDIGMPNEDGYSLIRRVRGLGKGRGGDIPAIALTAYARTEDRVKAIAAGFQLHVAKPVEAVELVTMVASAAGRTGRA